MRYKVLLIDDQHLDNSLVGFKKLAALEGIDIVSVPYHSEGMELLKKDVFFEFQAVILDATGFKDEQQKLLREVNNTGLRYSLMQLSLLAPTHLVPWFIYTGAPRNIDNFEFEEEISLYQKDIKFGRPNKVYYTKTIDEDELFQDIRKSIEQSDILKLMYKYRDVCHASTALFNDNQDVNDKILSMIKNIESDDIGNLSQDSYTSIRKIIEKLFRALGQMMIIDPILCVNSLNLNGCSRLLSNNNIAYSWSMIPIEPIIQSLLKQLLQVVQDSCHSEGNLELKVNYFHSKYNASYLYKSSVLNLFQILTYFEEYVKNNQDLQINESYWKLKKEVFIKGDSPSDKQDSLTQSNSTIDFDKKIQDLKKDGNLIKIGIISNIDKRGVAYLRLEDQKKTIKIPSHLVVEKNLKIAEQVVVYCKAIKVTDFQVQGIIDLY